MPYVTPGFYEITSPPVVTDKMLIVGGSVIDNYTTKEPSGVIRGFDVYSGRRLGLGRRQPERERDPDRRAHLYTRFTELLDRLGGRRAAWAGLRPAWYRRGDQWGGDRTAPRSAMTALWLPWISPPANCAGPIRTSITTCGTWISRPSPAWSICATPKAPCRRSISRPRPATSSCWTGAMASCWSPRRKPRCRKVLPRATGCHRRSLFPN